MNAAKMSQMAKRHPFCVLTVPVAAIIVWPAFPLHPEPAYSKSAERSIGHCQSWGLPTRASNEVLVQHYYGMAAHCFAPHLGVGLAFRAEVGTIEVLYELG